MTLVTTIGDATSDSYPDVATAQGYATDRGLAFEGANVDLEAALRRATAWVDTTYRARFSGVRVSGRAQALEWPRTGAVDVNGESIGSDSVPIEITNATIEAAIRELAKPSSLSPDVTIAGAKVLTQVDGTRWDVLSKPTRAEDFKPVLTIVDGILASLIGVRSDTKSLMRS